MGRASELWNELTSALAKKDDARIAELYAPEATYVEPNNLPHEGNMLVQSFLASWLEPRSEIDIAVHRTLESNDGALLAVEWEMSYTAAETRWNKLGRSTWIEVDDTGIRYQRDYF